MAQVPPVNDILTQRLDRLEQLMINISGDSRKGLQASSYRRSEDEGVQPSVPTGDLLDGSAARNAHEIAATNSAAYNESILTPESSSTSLYQKPVALAPSPPGPCGINHPYMIAQQKAATDRFRKLAHNLHALLPSAPLRSVLAFESPGASLVLGFAHSRDDQIAGRTEPHWSLASTSWPTLDTHPVLIAKRLLQYAVCMQYLPPTLDPTRMQLPAHQQLCELVGQWIAAVMDVTNDDEMTSCAEGIEALMLLSFFQAEAGHLRRAWITIRRALNLARLLGIDRSIPPPIRSCATPNDPKASPSMTILWYRLNCSDRYHSLILGLTPSLRKDDFIHAVPASSDRQIELLSKAHSVISRKIADRNDLPPRSREAYSVTESIELDFEQAVADMESTWWEIPVLPRAVISDSTMWRGSTSQIMAARTTLYMQVRHYTLLILLHLPFLLRDNGGGKHDHNRLVCMSTSRSVLERFLVFRKGNIMTISGRPIDYSALIAGMTLMLGHLGGTSHDDKHSDRTLVEKVLIAFRELGTYKRDRLAIESAETLNQLLPILLTENNQQPVRLNVPFLGSVNINPRPKPAWAYNMATNTDDVADPLSLQQAQLEGLDLDSTPALSFDTSGMFYNHPFATPHHDPGDKISSSSFNLEDWVFQGIDTTYWSTLNESLNASIEG